MTPMRSARFALSPTLAQKALAGSVWIALAACSMGAAGSAESPLLEPSVAVGSPAIDPGGRADPLLAECRARSRADVPAAKGCGH